MPCQCQTNDSRCPQFSACEAEKKAIAAAIKAIKDVKRS